MNIFLCTLRSDGDGEHDEGDVEDAVDDVEDGEKEETGEVREECSRAVVVASRK